MRKVWVVLREYGGWGGTETYTNVAAVFDAEDEARAYVAKEEADTEQRRNDLARFWIEEAAVYD